MDKKLNYWKRQKHMQNIWALVHFGPQVPGFAPSMQNIGSKLSANRRTWYLHTVAITLMLAMPLSCARKLFQIKNNQPIKLCCTVSLTDTNHNIHRLFVTADRQWIVFPIGSSLSQNVVLRTQVSAADTWCKPSFLVKWTFGGGRLHEQLIYPYHLKPVEGLLPADHIS